MSLLVAVDFSGVTGRQIAHAARLAREGGREVYLVHVAEPEPDFVGYEAGPEVVRKQVAAEHREEHRRLQALAEGLRDEGVEATALLVRGPIVETVLEQARDLDAGVIVVGSHGHGAAYQLVVGSISAGIIREADRPVLVVPARDSD